MTDQRLKSRFSLFFLCAWLAVTSTAHAQAPFYQGKTVTVIVGTSPAGTGDLRVKALIPFLRKHIPGNPSLVLEYMDGGGGRKAANYMFRTARPDGLTIGAMSSGVISLNIMRESGVLYDLDKFIYLARRKPPVIKPSIRAKILVWTVSKSFGRNLASASVLKR